MRTVSNEIMLVEKKINEDDNNNDDNKNNEPIKKSGCMSSNASEFIISTISLTCFASCMLIVSKMKRGR